MIINELVRQKPLTVAQWSKKIAWRHAVGVLAVFLLCSHLSG